MVGWMANKGDINMLNTEKLENLDSYGRGIVKRKIQRDGNKLVDKYNTRDVEDYVNSVNTELNELNEAIEAIEEITLQLTNAFGYKHIQ